MIVQYTIPLNLQRAVSFSFCFVRLFGYIRHLALKSFNVFGVGDRSIHCVTNIRRYTIECICSCIAVDSDVRQLLSGKRSRYILTRCRNARFNIPPRSKVNCPCRS